MPEQDRPGAQDFVKLPNQERWNEGSLAIEVRCPYCDEWYPKYDGYPWPGTCPNRLIERRPRRRIVKRPLWRVG